jgi:hypothetical protein
VSARGLAPVAVALLACTSERLAPIPGESVLGATLALELRDSAELTVAVGEDGRARFALVPSAGYGFFHPGAALTADGLVEPFPEADATLYVARFAAPAQPAGPCGSAAVSAALSLHRRAAGSFVAGGLAVYCGAARWHGTPARILRLEGSIAERNP